MMNQACAETLPIFFFDGLIEGSRKGRWHAVADKATALETYEELGTGGIAAHVCVDRSVEGHCKGGRLAVADEVTAPVMSCLILPRVVLFCLVSSCLILSCIVSYRIVSSRIILSRLSSSCLEGGLQWQRRPLPQKLMRYRGHAEELLIFVWTG
jgi:hypothetical protein